MDLTYPRFAATYSTAPRMLVEFRVQLEPARQSSPPQNVSTARQIGNPPSRSSRPSIWLSGQSPIQDGSGISAVSNATLPLYGSQMMISPPEMSATVPVIVDQHNSQNAYPGSSNLPRTTQRRIMDSRYARFEATHSTARLAPAHSTGPMMPNKPAGQSSTLQNVSTARPIGNPPSRSSRPSIRLSSQSYIQDRSETSAVWNATLPLYGSQIMVSPPEMSATAPVVDDEHNSENAWPGGSNFPRHFEGPWMHLGHPSTARVDLKEISNYSITHERNRLPSIRDSFDSSIGDPSFLRVQTSTPITHVPFALNLSFDKNSESLPSDTPLNLVVPKSTFYSIDNKRSEMALDLRKQKAPTVQNIMPPKPQVVSSLHAVNAEIEAESEVELNRNSDEEMEDAAAIETDGDFTADEMDPEWLPDGDVTQLDDLSIYEYFEQFKNDHSSGEDTDASADDQDGEIEENKGEPQPKKSKCYLRKRNRYLKEKGLQYTTGKGTVVSARQVQPACNCRMRCYEKFSEPVRKSLLSNLLQLTQSGQNQFLSSHISVIRTARPKVLLSRRIKTRVYKLPGVGGPVKVCKCMFTSTFDLKDRKVRVLADKLVAGAGIACDDVRKGNSSNKQLNPEHAEYIIKHIKSFPTEESHYSREKSSCQYLSSDLNIRRMYELYQDKCGQDSFVPVQYNTYRLAFKSLNLKFSKPKVDTCNTCDVLKTELRIEKDCEKRKEILARKEAHQSDAEGVYAEKRLDKQRANDDIRIRTISFDLQKQLATPYLTCGRAFYSRQLYTYNLTIFETQAGANVPICYLWDETRAKRGACEIGSCLWAYINALPACVEEVVMYSDRCPGQNNNRHILFLMAYVVEMMAAEGRNLVIHHKFMTSGHSHMECDTIHSAIERSKKKSQVNIEIPRDWNFLISGIRRKSPIIVKDMEQKLFLNWKVLSGRYTLPKLASNNEPFKFKSVRVFTCSTDTPGSATVKESIGDETPKQIHLLKSKPTSLDKLVLEPISTVPIPLPTPKLEDLRRLLPYISQKWYYEAFLKTVTPPGRGRKSKVAEKVSFDDEMDSGED